MLVIKTYQGHLTKWLLNKTLLENHSTSRCAEFILLLFQTNIDIETEITNK